MPRAIDPKTDPEGAYRWARDRLAGLRDRELELEALFAALAQQVTWGVVRCKDIVEYNQEATKLYNASVDLFTWFKPAADEIQRQTGIAIFPNQEVPLPQLIGTKYLVIDRGGGHKEFDTGVTCDASGNFPPGMRDVLQISPTPSVAQCLGGAVMNGSISTFAGSRAWSPYPTITDLRHGNVGLSGGLGIAPRLGGRGWADVAFAAFVVVGLVVLYKIMQRVLSTLDGTRALEIELESQSQVIKSDLARQECVNTSFQQLGGPSIQDSAAREELFKRVVEMCKGVVPKREQLHAKWWTGVVGLVAVGGLVAIGVIVAKGASSRRRSSARHADDD